MGPPVEGVAIGVAAALQFAAKVVEHRGRVSDEDVEDLREAGYEDGEIAEVIGHTALNIFSNYFPSYNITNICDRCINL